MVDTLTRRKRSWNMSRIRGEDTQPEKAVRSALHRMGFRFALHRRDLPGKPDIVLPRHRVIVFVHGCFWHRHKQCKYAYKPKSRKAFWQNKFTENMRRDRRTERALRRSGWKVVIVWECWTERPEELAEKLRTLVRINLRNRLPGVHR